MNWSASDVLSPVYKLSQQGIKISLAGVVNYALPTIWMDFLPTAVRRILDSPGRRQYVYPLVGMGPAKTCPAIRHLRHSLDEGLFHLGSLSYLDCCRLTLLAQLIDLPRAVCSISVHETQTGSISISIYSSNAPGVLILNCSCLPWYNQMHTVRPCPCSGGNQC